jgi:DNA-binding transcriptional ArsR family regulator
LASWKPFGRWWLCGSGIGRGDERPTIIAGDCFIVYRRWTMKDLSDSAEAFGNATLAPALAAPSHPVRIRILHHLCRNETCCCKEVVEQFDLAQSTVSQHLKVLVDAGLVRFKAERPRSCYCVDRDALSELLRCVNTLFDTETSLPGREQRGQQHLRGTHRG